MGRGAEGNSACQALALCTVFLGTICEHVLKRSKDQKKHFAQLSKFQGGCGAVVGRQTRVPARHRATDLVVDSGNT